MPVAAWSTDAITTTADDALAADKATATSPKRRDVKAWLLTKLADGPVPANDILADGEHANFSEKLIRGPRRNWTWATIGRGSEKARFHSGRHRRHDDGRRYI